MLWVGTSGWAWNMDNEIILESIITCPECGHQENESMPTDSCQFFYVCNKCNNVLRPLQGDCCVFCSYGSVKCPPKQSGDSTCGWMFWTSAIQRKRPFSTQ